ncbi:hypothetical protein PspTeo4_01112 [Pseudomonas sp. Teo4]|nr:hypothetical protein [Pseudomonas sp. Teo4]
MRGPLKVSVCIVTYNQERYIAQCLQSIVDQEVSFDFEVLVSDDASSDRTPEIISEFSRQYPDLIKPFLHKKIWVLGLILSLCMIKLKVNI